MTLEQVEREIADMSIGGILMCRLLVIRRHGKQRWSVEYTDDRIVVYGGYRWCCAVCRNAITFASSLGDICL